MELKDVEFYTETWKNWSGVLSARSSEKKTLLIEIVLNVQWYVTPRGENFNRHRISFFQ